MKEAPTFSGDSSTGFKARRLRTSQLLTQQDLAKMAGVSRQEVDSFERNLPMPLDIRRRILRELWAQKTARK